MSWGELEFVLHSPSLPFLPFPQFHSIFATIVAAVRSITLLRAPSLLVAACLSSSPPTRSAASALFERTPTPRLPPDVSRPSFPSPLFRDVVAVAVCCVRVVVVIPGVLTDVIEMCSSSSSAVHTLLVVIGVRHRRRRRLPGELSIAIQNDVYWWLVDNMKSELGNTGVKTMKQNTSRRLRASFRRRRCILQAVLIVPRIQRRASRVMDSERARGWKSGWKSESMKGQSSPAHSTVPSHNAHRPRPRFKPSSTPAVVELVSGCSRSSTVRIAPLVELALWAASARLEVSSVLGAVHLNEVLVAWSSVASCGRQRAFLRFARDRIWISSQPRRGLPSRWFLKLGLCAAPIGRCILGALRLKDVLVAGSSVASCGRCSAFSRVASDRIRISSQPCRLFQKRRCWHAEC
ncbi:hypothetical protein DFP72DRAFT_1062613 [Ephemerocybe angulata]|uniref:Uncharacterized protein n=1 Tax=Ephemerocybe angulata TaxID=980116 RepID=A0A8H6I8L1_9AGAR|nr:hypothetical protein DFP72DRAFT_1062613 [Tulosesus angulatus]